MEVQMFNPMNLAGLALFGSSLLITMHLADSVSMYMDLLTVPGIIIPMIAYTLICRPPISIKDLILCCKLRRKESKIAASYFKGLSYVCISSGILAFVLGLVVIVSNLTVPSTYRPGMAVALLSILYSLVAFFISISYQKFYEIRSLD